MAVKLYEDILAIFKASNNDTKGKIFYTTFPKESISEVHLYAVDEGENIECTVVFRHGIESKKYFDIENNLIKEFFPNLYKAGTKITKGLFSKAVCQVTNRLINEEFSEYFISSFLGDNNCKLRVVDKSSLKN